MPEDLREALEALLERYDARRRADSERERKTKDDEAAFIARFGRLRGEVIRPVLERAAALLEARGHACRIDEEEFSRDAQGGTTEASISLCIEPAGMPPLAAGDVHARTLTFATRHYNRTASVNAGRRMDAGGLAGSKGAMPLERLDAALVGSEVVKLVDTVLSG